MKHRRLYRTFISLAAMTLFITGAAKVLSSFGSVEVLDEADGLFFTSFRTLFRCVGALEIIIATLLLGSRSFYLKLGLLVWLSTLFMIYRTGLYLTHYQMPCGCLGNLAEMIGLSSKMADRVMTFIFLFLFCGSYLCLIFFLVEKTQNEREPI